MADIVSPEKRSRMMAGIGPKNTKPELIIRKGLHSKGFRYKLHVSKLPGKPDLVFPKFRAAVFVHGCFWHGHGCRLFKWPSTRQEFWHTKINRNRQKDIKTRAALFSAGWRIGIIWECAVKGKTRLPLDELTRQIGEWLQGTSIYTEIRGIEHDT